MGWSKQGRAGGADFSVSLQMLKVSIYDLYKKIKLRHCVMLPFTLPQQTVKSDGGQWNFCTKMGSELINTHIYMWYLQLLYYFMTLKGLFFGFFLFLLMRN